MTIEKKFIINNLALFICLILLGAGWVEALIQGDYLPWYFIMATVMLLVNSVVCVLAVKYAARCTLLALFLLSFSKLSLGTTITQASFVLNLGVLHLATPKMNLISFACMMLHIITNWWTDIKDIFFHK